MSYDFKTFEDVVNYTNNKLINLKVFCFENNLTKFIKEIDIEHNNDIGYKIYSKNKYLSIDDCKLMLLAGYYGNIEMVKYFLAKGEDPLEAFFGANLRNNTDVMEYLFDKISNTKKCFKWISTNSDTHILKYFLSKNVFYHKGLFKAVKYDMLENVILMTFYGFNFFDKNGYPPLFIAMKNRSVKVFEYLLDFFDYNFIDHEGNTVLNFFVKNCRNYPFNCDHLKILIKKVDKNICDNKGLTPFKNLPKGVSEYSCFLN